MPEGPISNGCHFQVLKFYKGGLCNIRCIEHTAAIIFFHHQVLVQKYNIFNCCSETVAVVQHISQQYITTGSYWTYDLLALNTCKSNWSNVTLNWPNTCTYIKEELWHFCYFVCNLYCNRNGMHGSIISKYERRTSLIQWAD